MLKLYNTLTKQIEEFKPIEENKVKMYVCGPTVYDDAHLGHARCYITWDVLYRYLKFLGYDVTYCRNVTDIDDKILKKADAKGVLPNEIAKKYYDSFSKSMKELNVLSPDIEPMATKTIGEMISMIKKLEEKGFAYTLNHDVYFDVKKDKEYGKLSGQSLDDLVSGARVDVNDNKKCPLDFALWKEDEIHGVNSPWGKGRPGWHIECSAMSKKHLGEMIDIHAGGADLIFPHHENEIAQSECTNGKKFVNYWLHNGFVTINKEKMSKSLNNFTTINELLKTNDANTIRYFILINHYRMPVEFNDEALLSAKNGISRLIKQTQGYDLNGKLDENAINEFKEAMDNDLNTSRALAVLFNLAKNKDKNTLAYLALVLGFDLSKIELDEDELKTKIAPLYKIYGFDESLNPKAVLDEIIKLRKKARDNKDFETSDKIRDEVLKAGIIFKDSKEETTWQIM